MRISKKFLKRIPFRLKNSDTMLIISPIIKKVAKSGHNRKPLPLFSWNQHYRDVMFF